MHTKTATFEGCLIVLEKGETEIKGCTFNHCRLMLLGQALRIAKILQLFIGDKPLKVLDFAEPGVFGEKKNFSHRGHREHRERLNQKHLKDG